MRLVEAVAGEVLHQVEDLGGLLRLQPALDRAVLEALALLGHDLGVLLAHGLAQQVGFAHGEAGEVARDAHDLFLVGDDAVGVAQDRLELRVLVLDLDAAVLALDVVVDDPGPQRAGPIERVQGDQVVEALRLGLAQRLAHARAISNWNTPAVRPSQNS